MTVKIHHTKGGRRTTALRFMDSLDLPSGIGIVFWYNPFPYKQNTKLWGVTAYDMWTPAQGNPRSLSGAQFDTFTEAHEEYKRLVQVYSEVE